MANLVSPGYKRSNLINTILAPVEERIIEFKGLNKRTVVDEGEMSDMWNLCADRYPVLSPRKPRGEASVPSNVVRPVCFIQRFNKLGLIAVDSSNNVNFYYDGTKISEVTGLTTSSWPVAINNKMCFFPNKTCIDITNQGVQTGTYRSLEATATIPQNGLPVTLDDTYAEITVPHYPHNFRRDDAININGTIGYTPVGGSAVTGEPISVSCVIQDINTTKLYVPRETISLIVGEGATDIELEENTKVERKVPSLDYIIEWNNRLWGCSSSENMIHACKLGDPTNWEYFQGTSMDSYYAEQGTDEDFTGIAEYSGHIIFFKPNSITRVYGTSPTNFQITSASAYGVEPGSSGSVLTINDTVFYKSAIGIMAYQGSVPICISEKFNCRFKNVVAGTEGTKYYASCLMEEGDSFTGRLMVFDIAKGLWHMEDDVMFTSCCKVGNKIYYTTVDANALTCNTTVFCNEDLMVMGENVGGHAHIINPDSPTESIEDLEWMATFGPFDEYIEEHKIYSKLAMRLKANGVASADVFISIDEGPWEQVEHYERVSTKGDFIPIIPRRCDRYSVKVTGKGDCEVKSLTRRVRRGTFGRL